MMKRFVITSVIIAALHFVIASSLFWYIGRHFDEFGRLPEPPLYRTACYAHRVISQPSGVLWQPLWMHVDAHPWVLFGSDAIFWALVLSGMINCLLMQEQNRRESDNNAVDQ